MDLLDTGTARRLAAGPASKQQPGGLDRPSFAREGGKLVVRDDLDVIKDTADPAGEWLCLWLQRGEELGGSYLVWRSRVGGVCACTAQLPKGCSLGVVYGVSVSSDPQRISAEACARGYWPMAAPFAAG